MNSFAVSTILLLVWSMQFVRCRRRVGNSASLNIVSPEASISYHQRTTTPGHMIDSTMQPPVGILLVNLGSPESPTYFAVMRYLREFLSDRRVIKLPRFYWFPILYGIVLPFRSAATSKKYQNIWRKGSTDAPLVEMTRSQAQKLEQTLNSEKMKLNRRTRVEFAMRYGREYTIELALRRFAQVGCQQILVIPLYPQPSESTTLSVWDALFMAIKKMSFAPEMRLVNGYTSEYVYSDAVAEAIRRNWTIKGKPDRLLLSFHGMPESALRDGDPYSCFCHKASRLIRTKLHMSTDSCRIVFQSRFGSAEWLKPYMEEVLKEFASKGIKNVDVACPGFPADCLETIDEVDREYKEMYHSLTNGKGNLRYIPALNDQDLGIKVLVELAMKNLQGWVGGE